MRDNSVTFSDYSTIQLDTAVENSVAEVCRDQFREQADELVQEAYDAGYGGKDFDHLQSLPSNMELNVAESAASALVDVLNEVIDGAIQAGKDQKTEDDEEGGEEEED